ncbi:MAG: cell division protein FtsZ, partial [Sediminibacterium sp.]|nr:cell division protein FtsZ [Sediminibacterium sp.]
MIQFDIPAKQSSIIKVIGVGGGGSNAVNYMYNQHIEGVDFIICNTDAKAIEQSNVPNKIQLGPSLTQGLGAGADPIIGKQATEESFEEIRKILEVNTKMAFITVGMGGGTGTGGAPIIAQICKELGILTVGIITTPFSFEGPKRIKNAEEGIKQLQPFVDTLLIINNDKLRMKYGNLKMKEAFAKADNILATAARCITDIITSKGHIIVDFADVCTVMKNGGVAILGKAEVEGENRAQIAIEESLNSPLLNDNDIKGAKWILININSTEGEYETTMDEVETINSYLREQSGEDTDVIMGMGYDDSLDKKIAITIVATGFEHSNPFDKKNPAFTNLTKEKENKIVYVLDTNLKTELSEPTNIFNVKSNQPIIDAKDAITTINPDNLEEKTAPTLSPAIELTVHTNENLAANIAVDNEPNLQKSEMNIEAIEKNILDQEVKYNFNFVENSNDDNLSNITISQKKELPNIDTN